MKATRMMVLGVFFAACAGGGDGDSPDAPNRIDAAMVDAPATIDAPSEIDATPPDAAIDATPPDAMWSATSVEIGIARGTADGPANLTITNATVTYIKPQIGNDFPGFTIQDEQQGPALFIAVDPASLGEVPVVGDKVSFTITQGPKGPQATDIKNL